jgi:tetratricopeptide (TPR) repeat protein
MSVAEQLQAAIRCQQAGQPAEAEKIYLGILKQEPEQADALSLLGSLALQRGDFDGAIDLIRRATVSRPEFADAHKSLGVLLARKGRLDEALSSYRRAIELRPKDARAHFGIGDILIKTDHLDDAIAAYAKAVESAPDFGDAYDKLAAALDRKGNSADAAIARRRAEMLKPAFLERLKTLGKTVWEKNQKDKVIEAYLTEIGIKPGSPGNISAEKSSDYEIGGRIADRMQSDGVAVHALMASVLAESDRLGEAEAAYALAAVFAPNAATTHQALGKILMQKGDAEGAVRSFQSALAIDPNLVSSLNYLGVALKKMGKFEEAAACFSRMVEMRPDLAIGYSHLASIGKIDVDKADTRQLLEMLAQPRLSIENRVALEFALGRAFDKARRYDEAFSHFQTANSIHKQRRASAGEVYNPATIDKETEAIIEVFTPQFFKEHADWGVASELPVFIVGMPRSGTTLVQQIAASHPKIHGAGELRDIFDIANGLGRGDSATDTLGLNPDEIREAANTHLRRLQAMNANAVRVIDKMPDNINRLGLIKLLFPTCRVILCRRDPRDICLSCFFQWFSDGNLFAFDLATCGHQLLSRERLVDHWRRTLPLRMLEVQYEELVADLEGQSRRLIDFLGLPWDPACLEFHRTESTVLTSSFWQVRQPLYQSSVGKWRHYEKHLGPLMKVLNQRPELLPK